MAPAAEASAGPVAGTVGAALDSARRALGGRVTDPGRDALVIWSGLFDLPAGDVFLRRSESVAGDVERRFADAVARRARGEPLAYVTGSAGFRRLTLRADRRALIPRPETEHLVELVLARAPRGRVADIGTGTGCIALSLRQEGAYDAIVAVDRSRDSLALAAENRDRTGLGVELAQGDLVAPLADRSLDLIVSNPPYLTEAEYEAVDPSVGAWEPQLALSSGADGLDAVRGLLDDGRRVARPGALLALEVDCTRAGAVASLAAAFGWRDVEVHQDLFGRERFVLARGSGDA